MGTNHPCENANGTPFGTYFNPAGYMNVYGTRAGKMSMEYEGNFMETESYVAIFESTYEAIAKWLPAPLEPDRDIPPFVMFVYWDTDCAGFADGRRNQYRGCALLPACKYVGEDGTVTNDIIFPEGSQMVYMPHPTKYRIYFDHGEFLKVPDPCQYVVFTFIDHENDGSEDWLAKRMEQLAYIQKRTSEGAVKSVIYEREKLEAIAALLAELPAGEETASGEAEGDEKLCVMLEDGTEFTLHYHSSTGKLRLGESEFYPAGTAYWSLDREQRQQLEALIANEATVLEHNGSADWLQEQLANVVCLQIRQYSSPQRPLEEVLPEYEVMQPGEQLEELAALLGSLPVRPKAELSQMYIDMFGDKVPPMMGRVTVGADGELSGSEKWILHEEGRKDMRRLDFVKADGEVVSVMYFPVMKAFSAQKAAFFLTEEQVAGVNALLGI